jgi:hypothetical protein
MRKPKLTPALEKRFPTKRARDHADQAIDALPASLSMSTYMDVWLASYRAAGGVEKRPGE